MASLQCQKHNKEEKMSCNYPEWVEDRGLENETWVNDRWCD